MWEALRSRQPGAPLRRVLWWHFVHLLAYYWIALCYRYRAWGFERVPSSGPVLYVVNHQSYLDPILVGLAGHHRQFYALARSTLFEHRAFSRLIRSMNAVPVERGASDMAAMRRCIDLLRAGNALLVFPEGTRTLDGVTGKFASGTMLLVKRAMPLVVPVAIEGAFQAWPKGRKAPRLMGRIGVMFGEPISAEKLVEMGAEPALNKLRDTVEEMRLELAERMGKGEKISK